jgi:hypothetical protein
MRRNILEYFERASLDREHVFGAVQIACLFYIIGNINCNGNRVEYGKRMSSVIGDEGPPGFSTQDQELAGGTIDVGGGIGGGDVELIKVCAGWEACCIPGNCVEARGSSV